MSFYFDGVIPASKSILNRLLVVSSFSAQLKIVGESQCDDVIAMRRALVSLTQGGQVIDCAAAGTTFRFLALLASRTPGQHRLTGTKRLLARPQQQLIEILAQLGVGARLMSTEFVIESEGWRAPQGSLKIDRSQSSQFASAVLLSAWELPFTLPIEFTGVGEGDVAPSEGYLGMTKAIVRSLGLDLGETAHGLIVEKQSRVRTDRMAAESDMSSAFAIAALAVIGGSARIREFPETSLQPDSIFPEILKKMGVSIERAPNEIRILKAERLRAIEWNLCDSPDLFPVLSVLCAFAEGRSKLYGAPHLALKESSRIESSAKLLSILDRKFEILADGMIIEGCPLQDRPPGNTKFFFDSEDDHRLAMAAAIAKCAGFSIEVVHPEVVDKSFPEFWQIFSHAQDVRS